MKRLTYILGILSILLLSSCSGTGGRSGCVTENEKHLTIKWGTIYQRTGGMIYRSVDSRGLMHRVEEVDGTRTLSDTIQLSPEAYCYIKRTLEGLILKTQAMYYPAEVQEFFEYSDSVRNVSFRAIWNPKYIEKIENREKLKALYDTIPYLYNK